MENKKLIGGLTALVGIPVLAGVISFCNNARTITPARANYTCDILVINPDGTSHYNIKEFNYKGEFVREYHKQSDKIFKRKPVFHSTTPVLTYPDGTIEGYRLLKEGEKLDDVLREGPVDSYVPPVDKVVPKNLDADKPKVDDDGWMPAKD